MDEHKIWEKEIKNPIVKIFAALGVVVLAIVLVVVASIVFVTSRIVEKIDFKNKRPL